MPTRYNSRNLHARAKQAEQEGDMAEAVKYYYQALKKDPADAIAYNRLMVYYRRRKEYRKELQVIQAAIASQQRYALDYQQTWVRRNKKTARTAKALAKSLGLINQKGMPVLETQQLNTWKKRMNIVRKRMKKQ
jgi:tetratricopeptide (TPR) repeat protein